MIKTTYIMNFYTATDTLITFDAEIHIKTWIGRSPQPTPSR